MPCMDHTRNKQRSRESKYKEHPNRQQSRYESDHDQLPIPRAEAAECVAKLSSLSAIQPDIELPKTSGERAGEEHADKEAEKRNLQEVHDIHSGERKVN